MWKPGWGKCGKRTSSGSSCPGASIPTAPWVSGNTSSRRTGRARSSRCRSTTSGCSRTACRACRRPRPRKKSRRWNTCASTAPSWWPRTSTAATPPSSRRRTWRKPWWTRLPRSSPRAAPCSASRWTARPRPASRRPRGSSSSIPRPSRTGSGPSTGFPGTSRATSTLPISTSPRGRCCCCPPSGCPPSFTAARATPSGSTRSRTRIRYGCIPGTPNASGSSPGTSSRSTPRSAISWTGSGSPRGSGPAWWRARITWGAGACRRKPAAAISPRPWSSWSR